MYKRFCDNCDLPMEVAANKVYCIGNKHKITICVHAFIRQEYSESLDQNLDICKDCIVKLLASATTHL